MDNASKAIIMAGSVLVAIAVMSIALYFYGVMKGYFRDTEETYTQTQVDSFNRFYQSYANTSDSTIYAIDVLNIYNKAMDDGFDSSQVTVSNGIGSIQEDNFLVWKYKLSLSYDGDTGRVSKISCVKQP